MVRPSWSISAWLRPTAFGEETNDAMNARTIDYAGLERATVCARMTSRSDIYFLGVIYYHMLQASRRCTKRATGSNAWRNRVFSKSRRCTRHP